MTKRYVRAARSGVLQRQGRLPGGGGRARASARRRSSRSATRRSPARPAAGRATATTPEPGRRARLDRVLGQRLAARRSRAVIAPRPPRSASAAASRRPTWPARARARTPRPTTATTTSSPGWTSTTTAPGTSGQAKALQAYAATPQRQDGRRADRRQRLRLRRHRPAVRDRLVLSPSWWPNYCNDDSSVTARFTAAQHQPTITASVADAFLNLAHRDAQRRLRRHRSGRSSRRPTRRRSRTARPNRYPRVGLHPPDDRRLRHLEPRRRLGQQHASSPT